MNADRIIVRSGAVGTRLAKAEGHQDGACAGYMCLPVCIPLCAISTLTPSHHRTRIASNTGETLWQSVGMLKDPTLVIHPFVGLSAPGDTAAVKVRNGVHPLVVFVQTCRHPH